MMDNRYKTNACRISCADENGTGFLVSHNKVVTAAHIFSKWLDQAPLPEITVEVCSEDGKASYSAQLLHCGQSPIAILSLSENVACSPSKLLGRDPTDTERVVAYGFPHFALDGYRVDFSVNTFYDDISPTGCNLVLDYNGKAKDLEGLSGAAAYIDDEIAGIMLNETNANGSTILAYALAGVRFREELEKCGIHMAVDNAFGAVRSTDLMEQLCNMQQENRQLRSAINRTFDKRLDEIMDMRLMGQEERAWAALRAEIADLEARGNKNKRSACFYLLAAVWSTETDLAQAERYAAKAISIDEAIDMRVFHTERALARRDYEKALACLDPVDNIIIVNQRAKALFLRGDPEQALQELTASPFPHDEYSAELLALIHFELGDFKSANEKIDSLLAKYPDTAEFHKIKGQILYGQGFKTVLPDQKIWHCVVIPPYRFLPDKEQQDLLGQAESHLQTALALYAEKLRHTDWIYAAILTIYTVLPGKDIRLWLRKYDQAHPNNCFSMLYRVVCKIAIGEKEINDFLDRDNGQVTESGYYQTKHALFVSLGRFDEAGDCLKTHGCAITNGDQTALASLAFSLAVCKKDWDDARKIAVSSKDKTAKKRMELLIDVQSKKLGKRAAAKALLAFANETHDAIDYSNAYCILRDREDWTNCLRAAKGWYKVSPELAILAYQVEALFNLRREPQALEIMEKIERAGYTSKMLMRFKARCLLGLSRTKEVLALLGDFQLGEQDAELALLKSQTFLQRGMLSDAICCLKDYVDRGYKNAEVMAHLVNLLRAVDLAETAKYARLFRQTYPNDDRAKYSSYYYTLLASQENEHEEYKEFISITPDTKHFRPCSIKEVRNIIADGEKESEQLHHAYRQMEMPLSTYMDANRNGSLGMMLYLQWHKGIPGIAPLICGAGTSEVLPNEGDGIVLDYTACVTAIEMGLLEEVCRKYRCYISHHLLPLMISEAAELNTIQRSQVQSAYQRQEAVSRAGSLRVLHDLGCGESINLYCLWGYLAEKYNYYVVSDSPGEGLNATLPDNWNECRIADEVFLAFLYHEGIITEDEIDADSIDLSWPSKRDAGKGFLLGNSILDKLSAMQLLSTVADSVDVAISVVQTTKIKNDADRLRDREKAAVWLDSIRSAIAKEVEEGHIALFNEPEAEIQENAERTCVLEEEMRFSEKSGSLLWCDDRWVNQYIAKGSQFISIMNMLKALYQGSAISLRRKIDLLYARHVGNFVPPAGYVLDHLKLCQLDETGKLRESSALKNVANMLCVTVGIADSLMSEPSKALLYSERNLFIINYWKLISAANRAVWHDPCKALPWKIAAATWLMEKLAIVLGTQPGKTGAFVKLLLETYIIGGALLEQELHKAYYDWLTPYLALSWNAAPELVELVAQDVGDFLGKELSSSNQAAAREIFNRIYEDIPLQYFRYALLNTPGINSLGAGLRAGITPPNGPQWPTGAFAEIDNGLLSKAVDTGDPQAWEELLALAFERPCDYGEQIVDYLDRRRRELDGKCYLSTFLLSLCWYVPTQLKPRIASIHTGIVHKSMVAC